MIRKPLYIAAVCAMCASFAYATPASTYAAEDTLSGPALDEGSYIVTIDADTVNINKSEDSEEVLTQASQGDVYQVLEDTGAGWVKVQVKDGEGYLPVPGNATITSTSSVEEALSMTQTKAETAEAVSTGNRQNIVNYALQFVGGRYKYGGSDPHSGVDCSGFTRYIMQHGAGISIARSSGSQASQGRAINASQMRPGDLIFYGNGRSINHVAMYIGDGRIVHASTESTGIKTSAWNYRTPVKIVNVLGD